MPRRSRPISVTLGDLQKNVEARVESGAYASVSEVLRAAVRALDQQETALNDLLRRQFQEAFADSRPDTPVRTVFKRLRQRNARRKPTAA